MKLIQDVFAAVNTIVPNDLLTGSEVNTVSRLIGAIVNTVFFIGIGICLAFAIVGGIKYATSGGDPKATGAARQTITNAVIGFIIVAGFRFIMVFVLRYLGGNETLPTNVGY